MFEARLDVIGIGQRQQLTSDVIAGSTGLRFPFPCSSSNSRYHSVSRGIVMGKLETGILIFDADL